MGKKTLSQTKNDIRSCLIEIVDPSPTKDQVDNIWKFFKSSCAYCGKKLDRKSRTAHLDHLVAKEKGFNHISNRVLSCSICNGDQKRESFWLQFIKTKGSDLQQKNRIAAIKSWRKLQGKPKKDNKNLILLRKRARTLANKICKDLEKKVNTLRTLRDAKVKGK